MHFYLYTYNQHNILIVCMGMCWYSHIQFSMRLSILYLCVVDFHNLVFPYLGLITFQFLHHLNKHPVKIKGGATLGTTCLVS